MKPSSPALPEVLERVVMLAHEIAFRTTIIPSQSLSLVALVQQSGYLQFRSEIDPISLRGALKERAEVLDAWLRYSSDKEANWGWFFERERRHGYTVGLRTGLSPATRSEIADPWDACAHFIKQEIEAIMGDGPRDAGETGGQNSPRSSGGFV